MNPCGGTEILYKNLIKYVGKDWRNINLITSVCDSSLTNPSLINVLWQHLSYDQYNVRAMNDLSFIDKIQHFVYVSNWQLEQFKQRFPIDHANNHVIRNAIEPIECIEKPKDKLRLIYTSMPERGLKILLDAFEIMDMDDVELVVYSSNIIYGMNYRSPIDTDRLFHRCKTMKNVVYKGYAMNNVVRKALQDSHVLAYPSIFEETSCLAAIEAGAAGCQIVTTNLGALPETCDQYATYVDHTLDDIELAHNYAEVLKKSLYNYSNISYNDIVNQSTWFNGTYSWENRAKEWIDFMDKICAE